MAGGEGTRMKPFTNIFPKGLIPVNGRPLIDLIIDNFKKYKYMKFNITTNYKSPIFKSYFKHKIDKSSVKLYEEKKKLGTAGSLFFFKKKIKNNFFVTNCDVMIEADYDDILNLHVKNKNVLTIVASFKNFKIPYGVCQINKSGVLKEIKEKPESNYLINTGFYVMSPKIFKFISNNKFLEMDQLINGLVKSKAKIGVYPIYNNSWFDFGQWSDFKKSEEILRQNGKS